MERQNRLNNKKYKCDYFVYLASLFLLAVSGIGINYILANYYGVDELGVFNQIFSIYIIAAQIGTLGIQFAVLKYIPENKYEKINIDLIVRSSIQLLLPISFFTSSIIYLFSAEIGDLLSSESVSNSLIYVAPGIFFFSFNKLFLNIINGLEKNKVFAIIQALRYLFIPIFLFVIVNIKKINLPSTTSLTLSEISICIILICYIRIHVNYTDLIKRYDRNWSKKIASFGVKAMWSGLAVEFNTRVDVIALGIFYEDKIVGLYSMAAFVSEMILQIPYSARRIIDPIFSYKYYDNQIKWIEAFVKRIKIYIIAGMFAICILALATYPIMIPWFAGEEFRASTNLFYIIIIGSLINSIYAPFFGLISQSGHPGKQSVLNLVTLCTNTFLNFTMIPFLGGYGAAIATSVSLILQAIYFKYICKNILFIKV